MKLAVLLALSVVLACCALDLDLKATTGLTYSTGQWGNSLNTGVRAGFIANWIVTPSLRAGAGFALSVFGSDDRGAASLTFLSPQIRAGYYLRPWGNVFNPGLVCSFGFCRSSLSNSGGTDPASWDPFWKAGLRWNFNIGGGFRGEVGGDYSSIMAQKESADSFILLFEFSREVTL